MKHALKYRACLIATVISIMAGQAVYAAPTYNDVPSTHWAYGAITNMADAGIIVGDSSGNYAPNQLVDKFSASKMLARLAGFKYVSLSTEEQSYQDRAYEANKSTLTMFKNTFTKWDASADKEIAFLIEKEILTAEDLNQFVVKLNDGTERTRALSKQEAAVFIVRILGRKAEAQAVSPSSLFSDDASINQSYRNYVYYLRELGVISGDNNNNFNPNSGVTRATMAVLLNQTYQIKNGSQGQGSQTGNSPSNGTTTIENVAGSIVTVYDSARALEVTINGRDRNAIVKVGNTAGIYVDGFVKTFADLSASMNFTGVLSNGEFIEVRAVTGSTATMGSNISSPDPSMQLTIVEGTVSAVKSEGAVRTVTIDVQILNPRGGVTTDSRSYTLSSDCKITRGEANAEFTDIVVADIVRAEVSGSSVYSIALEEKELNFVGTLVEKKALGVSGLPALVVKNDAGKEFELTVLDTTIINRKNSGTNLKYFDLRKGDKVDITAEYGKLIEVYGEGVRSTVEGFVQEIHIFESGSNVVFKNASTNAVSTYPVIDSVVDIYTMRVGSKLRLRLESEEIDSFTVIEEASTNTITGTIYNIRSSYMTVKDSRSSASKQIYFTDDTVVFDANTGSSRRISYLEDDMEVYVTFENGSTLKAKTITILSY